MHRREFLVGTSLAAAGLRATPARGADDPLRVGVIGHTGRGNYGHGLDTVWQLVPGTQVAGVADADAAGLAAAQKRLEVSAGFRDYREMLEQVRPDLVAVCPRHPDQHAAMILSAIAAGAKGVYVEKPYCRSPAEADQIQEACRRSGAKVAVAHRNRYHPALPVIERAIRDGAIGRPLEIRGRGKGDRRGGGEDLWGLGSHVLNLVCYFGGKPLACSGVLLQAGRRATRDDLREGAEALGPLAGNELHARYEMSGGVVAYFDSIANDGTRNAGFGLQLVGSEGVIDIDCDRLPLAHLRRGNPFHADPSAPPQAWTPITSAGIGEPEPLDLKVAVGRHVTPVQDLMAAIREDRQPLCGAEDGARTVEMICAVFASHVQGRTVELPLAQRDNPLAQL